MCPKLKKLKIQSDPVDWLSVSLCRYTLNPNTRVSQVWEVVGVVMSLVSVLAVSTQAAFLHDQGWLWAINYVTDLFFVADM